MTRGAADERPREKGEDGKGVIKPATRKRKKKGGKARAKR